MLGGWRGDQGTSGGALSAVMGVGDASEGVCCSKRVWGIALM